MKRLLLTETTTSEENVSSPSNISQHNRDNLRDDEAIE